MKHTKEEIINALKVIEEECLYQGNSCSECPFFVDDHCEIIRRPCNWTLNNPEPETWRAFK